MTFASDNSPAVRSSPGQPTAPAPANQRCFVLGVGISAIDIPRAVATIESWIATRHSAYVCVTGVHGVMESQSDPDLKRIHNNAGMVTPDGMPMVWMNRLSGHSHVRRVYGPDLMAAVCAESVKKGYRHFFYGGAEGVAELLKNKLTERFPGLQVVGTYCPPFRPLTPEEDADLAIQIEKSGADIVWVGLSTPKQERWMASHVGKVAAPVLIGVGAAFDFHAGLKKQAPSFIQKIGMEWCFRLVTEPKRLWKRYLRNNPLFIWYLTCDKLGLRKFRD